MAPGKQIIRVIYPAKNRRIALRTEADWDTDLPARSVSEEGSISEFSVETEGPFFILNRSCSKRMWCNGRVDRISWRSRHPVHLSTSIRTFSTTHTAASVRSANY